MRFQPSGSRASAPGSFSRRSPQIAPASADAKNQTTTYAYDALNRVTQISFHDGSKRHRHRLALQHRLDGRRFGHAHDYRQATDNLGVTTTSAAITIRVDAPP